MMIDSLDTQRADHIYRLGPETLAQRAYAVYAGPVARYAHQVTEMSQPGPDGFALKWVVSGRLEQPQVLKGQAPPGGVVPFLRQEQSGMLPQPPSVAAWERELGDLQAGDAAVLFFQGDPAKPSLKVLPSRASDHDLIALVRDSIAIQALPDASRQATAWLAYLASAHTEEGRKAGLRSLVANPVTDWPMLEPALQSLLKALPPAAGLRAYTTGIVAFAAMQDKWHTQQGAAIDFLCRQFEATQDAGLALQQVLTLKLVLNHVSDSPDVALRQRIFETLKRREASPLPPAMTQQFDQIRSAYPGQL